MKPAGQKAIPGFPRLEQGARPFGGRPGRGVSACERNSKLPKYPFVALACFLREDPRVVTLGVRPTLGDYTAEERRLLREAHRVLFPTMRFADVLEAGGCRCFPSAATYRYQRWRPLQWTLGAFLGLPMMRCRVCYGDKAKREIPRMFRLPFRVLGPRVGMDPVVCVDSWTAWEAVAGGSNPVIVSEWANYRWRREVWVASGLVIAWRSMPWDGVADRGESVWVPGFPEGPIAEVVERSLHVCRCANIDDAVLCWGVRQGAREHFFEGMRRPPPWLRNGTKSSRRHALIFSGLIDRPEAEKIRSSAEKWHGQEP